jgi:hypothetical protein
MIQQVRHKSLKTRLPILSGAESAQCGTLELMCGTSVNYLAKAFTTYESPQKFGLRLPLILDFINVQQ